MRSQPDFVVLQTNGVAIYVSPDRGQALRHAIAAHVPDLASQGMRRVRAWFADDFSDPALQANPLADQVIARWGYTHPSGWYGPVVVTMEEDVEGYIAPLTSDVRQVVDDLAVKAERAAAHTPVPRTEIVDTAARADSDVTYEAGIDSARTESNQAPGTGAGL